MNDLEFDDMLDLFTNKINDRILLSDTIERKFIDVIDTDEWEIETDKGFLPIKSIGKTIEYDVYEVETQFGKSIKCADTHIFFDEAFSEIFAKDLNKGTRYDKIQTKTCAEYVTRVCNLGYKENMYDIQVDSEDHRYWTNDILSHNSVFLANDAANFVRMGHNVAVVSAEMSDYDFIKRIGANLLDIKIDEYDKLAKQGDYIKKRLDSLSNGVIPSGRLFVKEVPTSAVSVPEIETYLIQLEKVKGVKLKVIVIDYINILANYRNPNTENTYMKIKQIAEDLRAMAVRNEWVVISATQLGKQGWDISDPTMAYIAESAGLSHTADIMYAIIQDDTQMIANEYMVKIIKVRNGKGKHWKCKYDIDYSHMKLSETDQIFEPKN